MIVMLPVYNHSIIAWLLCYTFYGHGTIAWVSCYMFTLVLHKQWLPHCDVIYTIYIPWLPHFTLIIRLCLQLVLANFVHWSHAVVAIEFVPITHKHKHTVYVRPWPPPSYTLQSLRCALSWITLHRPRTRYLYTCVLVFCEHHTLATYAYTPVVQSASCPWPCTVDWRVRLGLSPSSPHTPTHIHIYTHTCA